MNDQTKHACASNNNQGKPCGNRAMPGDTLCRAHRSIEDYSALNERVMVLQDEADAAVSNVTRAVLAALPQSLPPKVRAAVMKWREVSDRLARAQDALNEG